MQASNSLDVQTQSETVQYDEIREMLAKVKKSKVSDQTIIDKRGGHTN